MARRSKTISETAREVGLNPKTLRGWVRKHKRHNEPPDQDCCRVS
ncbi:transposase [Streptomyces sp. NPDC056661]